MRGRCCNSPYQITTVFGYVDGYPLNNGFHTGVDYVPQDGYIIAPQDSVVSARGNNTKDGNYLVLTGGGYLDWFSHISEYFVTVGQTVKKGERLAAMGETGAASGPHIHHSVRFNNELVDAEKHIKEDEVELANKGDVENMFEAVYCLKATQADIDFWLAGKPTVKQLFYGIKDSERYKVEHFINSGDVVNLKAKGINATAAKGKMWKQGAYMMTATPSEFVEVTEKLYRKK